MPLPNPKKGEKRQDFISRFMGNANARKEFPKQDQRAAVAYEKWRDKKK